VQPSEQPREAITYRPNNSLERATLQPIVGRPPLRLGDVEGKIVFIDEVESAPSEREGDRIETFNQVGVVLVNFELGEIALDRGDAPANPLGFYATTATVPAPEGCDVDLSVNFQASAFGVHGHVPS